MLGLRGLLILSEGGYFEGDHIVINKKIENNDYFSITLRMWSVFRTILNNVSITSHSFAILGETRKQTFLHTNRS